MQKVKGQLKVEEKKETEEKKEKGDSKPTSQKGLLILVIVVLVLAGLYLGGKYLSQGGGQTLVGSFLSRIIGRDVKIEENGESTTIKSEDQEISFSVTGTLPEGFPQDFPLYPEATISSSFTAKGEGTNGTSIVLGSQDAIEKVIEFYKSELPQKGWKIVSNFEQQGSSTISFEKELVSGFLGITKGEKGISTISVTIGVKEK